MSLSNELVPFYLIGERVFFVLIFASVCLSVYKLCKRTFASLSMRSPWANVQFFDCSFIMLRERMEA